VRNGNWASAAPRKSITFSENTLKKLRLPILLHRLIRELDWRGFLLQDEAQKPPLAGGKQGFLQRSIAAKSPPRYSRINRWSNTALKAKNWCKKFYALYDTCKDYIEDFSCTVDEDTGEVIRKYLTHQKLYSVCLEI